MSENARRIAAHALAFMRTPRGIALVVVLVAAGWLARGCGGGGAVDYETEAPHRGELVVHVTATGTLQPINQVDVGSELSGQVRDVYVDFNDIVKKGQVIARINPTRLEGQVSESQAALDAAVARIAQAKATRLETAAQLARLERVHEMSGGKVPSATELDAARAVAERARAEVASMEAAAAQTRAWHSTQRTDLAKTAIRSPIDGIVLKRTIEPGQTVAASLQAPVLFTLAEDLTHMELLVSVDEADVAAVAEQQPAKFTVDAWPGERFDAEVAQVRFGADALEGVVTYGVLLRVDNAGRRLRPGMTATAEIEVKRVTDALLVPNAALRFAPPETLAGQERGFLSALFARRPPPKPRATGRDERAREQRVYRLREGELEAVDVTVGATDGMFTEIVAGELSPEDALAVSVVTAKP